MIYVREYIHISVYNRYRMLVSVCRLYETRLHLSAGKIYRCDRTLAHGKNLSLTERQDFFLKMLRKRADSPRGSVFAI